MSDADYSDSKKVLLASITTTTNHISSGDVITSATDVISGQLCLDGNVAVQQPDTRNREQVNDPEKPPTTNNSTSTTAAMNANNNNNNLDNVFESSSSFNHTDSVDPLKNPFTASGKLSRKADYIISHSTITRTELRISDPDIPKKPTSEEHPQPEIELPSIRETVIEAEKSKLIESGVVNGYASSPVQVEVSQTMLDEPEKGTAEQIINIRYEIRFHAVRYDTIPYDTILCDTISCDTIQFDTMRHSDTVVVILS
ncbi:hypothetical protein HELRODRAFT_173659 [Helobdella robusta]|uniref:Uncharacterized protein n=1 Tax=Helobdella robusta TaxID=6412 RepID=T1F733_HELRO|nr:hypothetical protein HELRODRAFT_173659 [Helobdella robusta]ESO03367.1 hypothetical protein HELRODRAFT_173659 [Helobdella robusta]